MNFLLAIVLQIAFTCGLQMLAVQAMQAQNMMWAPAVATTISSVANVGINMLLIRWYGFQGAAAAFSVTRVLLFLLLAGKAWT